jgi:hypothetical protein
VLAPPDPAEKKSSSPGTDRWRQDEHRSLHVQILIQRGSSPRPPGTRQHGEPPSRLPIGRQTPLRRSDPPSPTLSTSCHSVHVMNACRGPVDAAQIDAARRTGTSRNGALWGPPEPLQGPVDDRRGFTRTGAWRGPSRIHAITDTKRPPPVQTISLLFAQDVSA